MLFFYCAEEDADLTAAHEKGLRADDEEALRLYLTLEAAEEAGDGPILVVDSTELDGPSWEAPDNTVRLPAVPPEALRNLDPYQPPRPVTAGGGYVVRARPDALVLLVIYRRGVWDLPKGAKDTGESIETCAVREVREEVGIDQFDVIRSLGTTQHDYVRDDIYTVKTTHWYLMHTPQRSFEPDRHEGIERVAWARWPVAREHIGYDTLRRHMDKVEPNVRAAVG